MDPAKASTIWGKACENEMMSWRSPATIMKKVAVQSASPPQDYYRVPYAGEPVTIAGMRRRPDLNGAQGEIVSSALDAHGRVLVKVFDTTADGMTHCKTMKIEPTRLIPSASAPSLLQSKASAGGSGSSAVPDDRSSVRSVSRSGSVVSFGGGSSRMSRTGSGALSTAGRGALSNTGRSARPMSGNGVPTSGTGWLHLQARNGVDSKLFDTPVIGKIGVDLSLKERPMPTLDEEM
eukprot:TRINITY_DN39487_c0_g1_i1.p1 TRINITY_DN39487_c0_g1~~TRINITY_DN39487_c0_g1_i1.p1  ORF type:complete len:235 (+),score=48.78 TRINITY_DN39487_c0_g1_i1:114-818(+)